MIEHPDLLEERFAGLRNQRNDSDWLDVRRRSRLVARRWLLIPLAATIAAILVGSAFALYRELVDFQTAEPAPERIQVDFNFLREHTAEANSKVGGPSYTPEGPAREVMRVQVDAQTRPLWVVPTREGGLCFRLHFAASCLTGERKHEARIGVTGLATSHGGSFQWLAGPVTDETVQEVDLVYQDGESVRVPFVWVSAPIGAGFYAYDVPEEHEQPGRLAVVLIGRDEDGKSVTHTCLTVAPDELARSVPEVVALCKRGP